MKIYAHDRIYFAFIPVITNQGWAWMRWVREVLTSEDGKKYSVLKREKHNKIKTLIYKP